MRFDWPRTALRRPFRTGSPRERRSREQLAATVQAWRLCGPAALSVLDEEWTVEGEQLARARAALVSAWVGDERRALRAIRNRWTVVGAGRQLRLGHDGRWWPYRKRSGR